MNAVIASILATRLATLGYDIEAENARFVPTAGKLYLREQLLSDVTQHRQLAGGARNNGAGLYQITVMAPRDESRMPARMAADAICAAFPPGWRGSKSGVTVAVREVTVGPSMLMGDRFGLVITIAWIAV